MMKKLAFILMAVLLCLTGCNNNKQEEEVMENTQIANPMVSVESSEEFSQQLEVNLPLPENGQDALYFVVAQEFAQINCTIDGNEYIFRASKLTTDGEELSGIFGDWIASDRAGQAEYYKIDDYFAAVYYKDDVTYTVTCQGDEESLAIIVEDYINNQLN